MKVLNLPPYQFKFREVSQGVQIFDAFRKKYVILTPEEWVRQNFLQYLAVEKSYPASLIAVEVGLSYNRLRKRADILVYDRQGQPFMMVECKAPEVNISQDTFDQVARYNMAFKVRYLVVTNGMQHFCCAMDYTAGSWKYLDMIPAF